MSDSVAKESRADERARMEEGRKKGPAMAAADQTKTTTPY